MLKKTISFLVFAWLLLMGVSLAIVSKAQKPAICNYLDGVVNTNKDSSPAIKKCIEHAKGEDLILKPGIYSINTPLIISRSIKIESIDKNIAKNACKNADPSGCAVIVLGEIKNTSSSLMPVEVMAADVAFSHIAIVASNDRTPDWKSLTCGKDATKPLAGGIRVSGSSFVLDHSLIRGMSCYTALEIVPSSKASRITNNIIGPNGVHRDNQWSDGITIHDSQDMLVSKNIFIDNTDVQLILGGCLRCEVSKNIFRHGRKFESSSFAELMIHAWSNTSGNFYGSGFFKNTINCGTSKRCGYGIMIGGQPWYDTKARGGKVTGNNVDNAMVGLNVDSIDGEMIISGNQIKRSGGYFSSDCGEKQWPAINISKESEKYVGDLAKYAGSIDTRGCIINRIDNMIK